MKFVKDISVESPEKCCYRGIAFLIHKQKYAVIFHQEIYVSPVM